MNNSLENAKVGDTLLVTSRWCKRLLTVDKVQKNFVIAGVYKFRKSNGSCVDSSRWFVSNAILATQEDIDAFREEVRRGEMISQCRDIKFEGLSDTQLEQILEIANTPELLNEKER